MIGIDSLTRAALIYELKLMLVCLQLEERYILYSLGKFVLLLTYVEVIYLYIEQILVTSS